MTKASCWKGILGIQRNAPETYVKLCLFHLHPIQEPSLHIPAEAHCHTGQAGCDILQRTVLVIQGGQLRLMSELSSGAKQTECQLWPPSFLARWPGQGPGSVGQAPPLDRHCMAGVLGLISNS